MRENITEEIPLLGIGKNRGIRKKEKTNSEAEFREIKTVNAPW